ncbi:hypothetical protein M0P25_05100, partial [archaeon]|nr:hypothetical protein [archaeon]
MNNIVFYKKSYEYLLNKLNAENYTDIMEVNSLLNGKYSTDTFFDRLLSSAQNYQGMPNYIGYWKRNRESIRKAVFYPNIKKAADCFQSSDELFNAFIIAGADMKNSQKSWLKYSNTIFKGLKFLSKFNSQEDFKDDVESYAKSHHNDYKKYVIDNLGGIFGFALGCDFLKEQGFLNYSKPDVHIKAVLSLKLILEYKFPHQSLVLS